MGRWSNEKRAEMARQAAEIAKQANTEPVEKVADIPETPQAEERPDTPQFQRVQARNEGRRQAMEEITNRDIETKTGLGMELGLSDEEKPKTQEKTETPGDLPPPTAESMLQGGKFSAPQQTVRVKVDGEEFDAPNEEVEAYGGVKGYQIAKAAEKRLAKANEVLAQAQALQAAKKPEVTQQSPSDFLKSKVETIRWGTPEDATKAFEEILEKQGKPAVDQETTVKMVMDQITHNEAVKNFDKEFPDIGASQLHLKLVVALREERLQKGHPGDWTNFYRSLGNEVRAVMPKQSQPGMAPKTADITSQTSDREARKASTVVSLPQAASRAAVPDEPKPETREDTLNAMRKKRGFATE